MITLDLAAFRALFPEFVSDTAYPDATVQMYWDVSTAYISAEDYGWLEGAARSSALNFMTAHILKINTMAAAGQTAGLIQSTNVDNVSVSLMPPPVKNQFHWWLSTTPYGAQLLALLQMYAVGGLTVGGRPERAAFRKVGGAF